MPLICMYVFGGLGNQLFMIFAMLGYTFENGVPFKICPLNIGNKRPYYWGNFLKNLRSFITYDEHSVRILNLYKENDNLEYNKIESSIDKFRCYGYFQSYKYFEGHLENIMRMTGIDKQKQWVCNMYNGDTSKTVSLHVRIGDYVKVQEYHNILSINYYKRALCKVIEKRGEEEVNHVLIFGEQQNMKELLEIKTELETEYEGIEFEIIDSTLRDYNQMLIMSNCRDNIIANSSFSLMAAHINLNNDKIVVYPNEWFGPLNNDKKIEDMFREEWIKC